MEGFQQIELPSDSSSDDDEPAAPPDVARLYKQPGHPVAFSAPNTVYQYFKGQIPLAQIRQALEQVDAYTLHREYKKPRHTNPFFAFERRKHFQADLISIEELQADNEGIKYLLLIIDVFTRKIWVVPLRRKDAGTTAIALAQWLDAIADDASPAKVLLTDRGGEFRGQPVRRLLRDRGVEQQFTHTINKAAVAERANKSLQILIYKYLTDRGETEYLTALPQLVRTYNSRPHRSLRPFSPDEADAPERAGAVRSLHLRRHARMHLTKHGNLRKRAPPKFAVGDMVRIKTYALRPSPRTRAYRQQFAGELFRVVRVRTRMPVTMYDIKSMDTEEEIEGGFYANELQRVRGDAFKIERILARRGRGNNEEVLVRWKYFGPRWDAWIPARDIIEDAL